MMESITQSNRLEWLAKAGTLAEALPYMRRYSGHAVVVKFGGHAMPHLIKQSRCRRINGVIQIKNPCLDMVYGNGFVIYMCHNISNYWFIQKAG